MFHEHRDLITELKTKNARFVKLFERHHELDHEVEAAEAGRVHMDRFEIEGMKKEKLKLKDEIYQIILEYKKEKEQE
ncbi:MAG: DUF465 domain-containing protein [Arcobacter butzleri]|jgi:uncharacterized protein YdcH (DUF465 family)|nr:DUF465 domain-containing protein [Arcobacteraceae bacterium]MDY0365787.1 DUF465 domain-containing protein [Arcobacteraceae bacterium]NLO17160.1 DUF465 domain-containing protein [Aliarcobacter butzleri]